LESGLARASPHFPRRVGRRDFLGIGCSGLGYLFWYGALERIEVSRVAAFLYVEPLVTLSAAVLLLKENVTASTLIGGLLVLASVFIIQRAPMKVQNPRPKSQIPPKNQIPNQKETRH